MKKPIVYTLAFFTALFWGLSFIAMRILMEYMDSIEILALRWGLSAILFIALIVAGVIRVDWKSHGVKMGLLAGILEPGIYSLLEVYGLEYTSASISSVFVATTPCMTLIIGALFFHRKTGVRGVISIILAFVGVGMCTLLVPGAIVSGNLFGYALLTCTALAGALYAFAAEKSGSEIDPLATTAIMAIFGGVEFNVINLLTGHGLNAYVTCIQIPEVALGILFLGLCCSTFAYFSLNIIFQVLNPALTNNVIGSSVTIIGVLGGIFILHETWGWYTVVGLTLTVVGVFLSAMSIEDTSAT